MERCNFVAGKRKRREVRKEKGEEWRREEKRREERTYVYFMKEN